MPQAPVSSDLPGLEQLERLVQQQQQQLQETMQRLQMQRMRQGEAASMRPGSKRHREEVPLQSQGSVGCKAKEGRWGAGQQHDALKEGASQAVQTQAASESVAATPMDLGSTQATLATQPAASAGQQRG